MKKVYFIIAIIFMIIMLVGCEKKTTNDTSNTSVDEVNLFSDSTKLVFESNNTKHVFYYKDDTVTAYHTYTDYNDSKTAKSVYDAVNLEKYSSIKKYYTKGKYLVVEYEENEYSNLKVSKLREIYSNLKEVKKSS